MYIEVWYSIQSEKLLPVHKDSSSIFGYLGY